MRRVSRMVRPINSLLQPVSAHQRRDVDAVIDKTIRQAESDSGGTAAGDEAFIDDYRRLYHQTAAVPSICARRSRPAVAELRSRLANRFRVHRLIAERPEITDEPIEQPVIVTGLPRTATTLAHKILAQPEGHRAPLMWELQATDRADADAAIRKRRR